MLAEEEDEKEVFISCSIKAHRYWPKLGKEEKYGDFIIENVSELIIQDFFYHELYLTNITTKKTRKIHFFKYIGWQDMGIPENTKSLRRIFFKN